MSTYEANHAPRRAPRLWIVETLVVVGILAFSYFAITMDASPFTGTVNHGPVDPIAELTR